MKSGYTYIMTNKHHNVLYVGCTVDIVKRVAQHKQHFYKGSFTDRYNCEYCVYFFYFTRSVLPSRRKVECPMLLSFCNLDTVV